MARRQLYFKLQLRNSALQMGMKANNNKFEPCGKVHEGMVGAVVTCLPYWLDARQQTISYMLNGEHLGVAFTLPLWMADVPLLPALCRREDWRPAIRREKWHFPVPMQYLPLAELQPRDGVGDEAEIRATARELFALAPQEDKREISQLDVPDTSLGGDSEQWRRSIG